MGNGTSGAHRIRVVLADGHTLFRDGIRQILAESDIDVVADVANSHDALRQLERLQPEVAVFDGQLPGLGSLALLRQAQVTAGSKIVFLSTHWPPGLVADLEARGAAAYLSKSVDRTTLIATIQAAAAGLLIRPARRPDECGGNLLTARELQVLGLVAHSKSNREIAAELYLSESTVKRHLASIYEKLDATSRLDAMMRAMRGGLISG